MAKLLPYLLIASCLGSLTVLSTYLSVKTHQHAYITLVENPQPKRLV